MTLKHNFNTTIDGVNLRIIGSMHHDGSYEIMNVLQDGTDIQDLIGDWVETHIRNEAVRTLDEELAP